MKRLVISIAAAAWSPLAPLAAAPIEGLSAAVAAARAGSPEAAEARALGARARAGASEAGAMRLPRAAARGAVTRGDSPVYAFGSLLDRRAFEARHLDLAALNRPGYLTAVHSELELALPLFSAFEPTLARRQGLLGARAAEAAAREAGQGAAAQAVDAYLRVLQSRLLLAELEERLASSSRELGDAHRLRARGLAFGSDLQAAEALHEGLKAWKARLEPELDALRGRLEEFAGGEVGVRGTLTARGYDLPPFEALLEEALSRRPDLERAETAGEAAAAARRRADSSVLPRLEAFASLRTDGGGWESASSRLVGVRAGLPLGDPAYPARRRGARQAERAAEASREAVERRARLEVTEALGSLRAAEAALEPAGKAAELAAKALESFRPLYRAGRQSVLEVLRAEEALARARAARWEALLALHLGYSRLRLACGGLDEASVAEIASRLEAAP